MSVWSGSSGSVAPPLRGHSWVVGHGAGFLVPSCEADSGRLGLGDPGVGAQGFDQVVEGHLPSDQPAAWVKPRRRTRPRGQEFNDKAPPDEGTLAGPSEGAVKILVFEELPQPPG